MEKLSRRTAPVKAGRLLGNRPQAARSIHRADLDWRPLAGYWADKGITPNLGADAPRFHIGEGDSYWGAVQPRYYNILTGKGTAASRVFFRIVA